MCPVSFCACICPSSQCLPSHVHIRFPVLSPVLRCLRLATLFVRCHVLLSSLYRLLFTVLFLCKFCVPIHQPFSLHLSSLSLPLAILLFLSLSRCQRVQSIWRPVGMSPWQRLPLNPISDVNDLEFY